MNRRPRRGSSSSHRQPSAAPARLTADVDLLGLLLWKAYWECPSTLFVAKRGRPVVAAEIFDTLDVELSEDRHQRWVLVAPLTQDLPQIFHRSGPFQRVLHVVDRNILRVENQLSEAKELSLADHIDDVISGQVQLVDLASYEKVVWMLPDKLVELAHGSSQSFDLPLLGMALCLHLLQLELSHCLDFLSQVALRQPFQRLIQVPSSEVMIAAAHGLSRIRQQLPGALLLARVYIGRTPIARDPHDQHRHRYDRCNDGGAT